MIAYLVGVQSWLAYLRNRCQRRWQQWKEETFNENLFCIKKDDVNYFLPTKQFCNSALSEDWIIVPIFSATSKSTYQISFATFWFRSSYLIFWLAIYFWLFSLSYKIKSVMRIRQKKLANHDCIIQIRRWSKYYLQICKFLFLLIFLLPSYRPQMPLFPH